jgi:LuxR family maltose regulon positive regulatory protein
MTISLLSTKLYLPPLRPDRVSRPHLIRRLDEGLRLGHRVTLISAPAGFGKTTLLSEWIASRHPKVAWVSLDEGDNDPVRFWAYFTAALRITRGEGTATSVAETAIGGGTLTLPHSSPSTLIEATLAALINEIAERPELLIFALDDYHVIETPTIHDALTFLLDRMPPQMHLVIASRADPPLPLACLRARGQLTELRAADLRFMPGEVAAFLNQGMGLNLSDEDVSALEARTEGWIAGLQLAALSMQGRENAADFISTFDGSHRYVMDYLFEEVLRRQTADVREFLVKTAILDRLTAPLCNAVTESKDGAAMLAHLEQANLFLMPLDDRREWYRYHHLFADFLRTQLEAGCRADLHCKAAQWHAANGFMEEAVKHALVTGDAQAATHAILAAAPGALRHGQVTTLLGWLDALPDEVVRANHWLAGFKGWVLAMTGRIEAAESYVEVAEKNLSTDAAPFDRGFFFTVRAYISYGCQDWAGAITLFREALDLVGEIDSVMKSAILVGLAQALYAAGDVAAAAQNFRQAYDFGQKSGNYYAGLSALIQLAWLRLEQGQRREVAALCQQAIERCVDSQGKPLSITGWAYLVLGQACYQANELAQACKYLLTGLELLTRTYDLFRSLWGKIVLAQVYQALGEKEVAQKTLQEVLQTAAPIGWLKEFFDACEADYQSRTGRIAAAGRWLEAHFSPTAIPCPKERSLCLMCARVRLRQGRPREAQTILADLERVVRQPDGFSQMLPAGFFGTLTDLLILQALAFQALGREEAALARLEEALRLAAPEGCRRVFLEEGPAVIRLLPHLRHVAPDFVDQLLADFAAEAGKRSEPAQGLAGLLTDREFEVLRLIATGLRNQEIADRLVISQATVKRHITNLYGKLDASHRAQALARAREIGLL